VAVVATNAFNVGVAGSGAADVVSVQGVGGMTPLSVTTGSASLTGINGWGGVTLGAASNYGTSPGAVKVGGVNAYVTNGAAAGSAGSPSTDVLTVQTPAPDACALQTHTFTPISISTATTTRIVTGVSSKKIYICHIYLFTAAANNVAVVEGTSSCASPSAGVIGGTTTGTGINLGANSGWTEGMGSNAIAATTTNADDLCLITSASTQLSGVAVTVTQ
jgi:hypothetical protein